jgi:hypothetical protein
MNEHSETECGGSTSRSLPFRAREDDERLPVIDKLDLVINSSVQRSD